MQGHPVRDDLLLQRKPIRITAGPAPDPVPGRTAEDAVGKGGRHRRIADAHLA